MLGTIYAFGRNNHGQLGTGDTEEHHSPVKVQCFVGLSIRSLAAGFYHTIALVSSSKHQKIQQNRKITTATDTKEEKVEINEHVSSSCRPRDAKSEPSGT